MATTSPDGISYPNSASTKKTIEAHIQDTATSVQTALNTKAASSHVHSAADITSGTLDTARYAAGTIIQVVTAASNTAVATSPTSFTAITGLSISITPRRANSLIIVEANLNGTFVGADGGRRSMLTIYRNASVNLASASGAGSRSLTLGGFANGVSTNTYSTEVLVGTDYPGVTTATTYQVYGRIEGTDVIYFNRQSSDVDSALYPRGTSVLVAYEVAV